MIKIVRLTNSQFIFLIRVLFLDLHQVVFARRSVLLHQSPTSLSYIQCECIHTWSFTYIIHSLRICTLYFFTIVIYIHNYTLYRRYIVISFQFLFLVTTFHFCLPTNLQHLLLPHKTTWFPSPKDQSTQTLTKITQSMETQ